jgi:hypothetical protein
MGTRPVVAWQTRRYNTSYLLWHSCPFAVPFVYTCERLRSEGSGKLQSDWVLRKSEHSRLRKGNCYWIIFLPCGVSHQIDLVIAFHRVWRFDVENLRGFLRIQKANQEPDRRRVYFFFKNYRQTPAVLLTTSRSSWTSPLARTKVSLIWSENTLIYMCYLLAVNKFCKNIALLTRVHSPFLYVMFLLCRAIVVVTVWPRAASCVSISESWLDTRNRSQYLALNTRPRVGAVSSFVKFEVFTAVPMKNAVFWVIKAQFIPHRRHIASPLQSPAC